MKKFFAFPAVALAAMLFFFGQGRAQTPAPETAKLEMLSIKGIERFDTLSDEQFAAQTEEFIKHLESDKYVDFKIRLPEGWREAKSDKESNADTSGAGEGRSLSVSRRVLGKIARYYGPARLGTASHIEVSAAILEYGITARNWFLNSIFDSGYILQGIEEINDRRIEALYVAFRDDTPYMVRAVAEINGPRMIIVSYFLPEQYWEDEKAMQEKVLSSFEILFPEKKKVETSRTYSFLDVMRFDYPASWNLLAPSVYSVESMDARLIRERNDGTLDGQIEIHMISTELDTTLAREVQHIREDIEETGFDIGDLIETQEGYKMGNFFYFNRVEAYHAPAREKSGLNNYELWLAIMVEDRYYYIITMLTPDRNFDFYVWATNAEAFKSVLESIRK